MQAYQLKDRIKPKHSPRFTRNRGRLTSQHVTRDATTDPHSEPSSTADPTVSTMPVNSNPPPKTPVQPSIESMFENLTRELKSSNGALSNEIKMVNTTMTTLSENIDSIRGDLKSHQDQMDTKLKTLEDQNQSLGDRLTIANERIVTLENLYFDVYQKQESDAMSKQALNLIIRGIPEVPNEKMHVVMTELLTPIQSIAYTQTNGAYRIGKVPKPIQGRHDPQPRPIKLKCATVLQKGVLFRGIAKIREIPKFPNVKIMNDLNKDELMVHKEVQIIYTEATSIPNVNAKMKGPKIEIDGKLYDRSKFDSLPHGITRSTASTVVTDKAVVFQGHCSPYSNLHHSNLEDGTYDYSCNEQHFGYKKATDCGNDVLASKILCETNPYSRGAVVHHRPQLMSHNQSCIIWFCTSYIV